MNTVTDNFGAKGESLMKLKNVIGVMLALIIGIVFLRGWQIINDDIFIRVIRLDPACVYVISGPPIHSVSSVDRYRYALVLLWLLPLATIPVLTCLKTRLNPGWKKMFWIGVIAMLATGVFRFFLVWHQYDRDPALYANYHRLLNWEYVALIGNYPIIWAYLFSAGIWGWKISSSLGKAKK